MTLGGDVMSLSQSEPQNSEWIGSGEVQISNF